MLEVLTRFNTYKRPNYYVSGKLGFEAIHVHWNMTGTISWRNDRRGSSLAEYLTQAGYEYSVSHKMPL